MKHLACIMDGNRRWAVQNKLEAFKGHQCGIQSIKVVMNFCLKENIKYLSLYTFSLENLKRSEQEKTYLFDLLLHEGKRLLPDFCKEGIRVQFIGEKSLFPERIMPMVYEFEEKTKMQDRLFLQLLFCYGSRQEIVGAVKNLIAQVQKGELNQDAITEETFNNALWTASIPEPDLIIRTGGALRLSNFLLYQAAYSEFYFLKCFWPEIQECHLKEALDHFRASKRNFGT